MKNNLEQTLNFYCINELNSFKGSKIYLEMYNLTTQLGLSVESSIGSPENDIRSVYLDFRIVNTQGQTVVVDEYNYEHLCDATLLICIDKRERIKFFSWKEDDDFIDSVNWVLEKLKEKLKTKI